MDPTNDTSTQPAAPTDGGVVGAAEPMPTNTTEPTQINSTEPATTGAVDPAPVDVAGAPTAPVVPDAPVAPDAAAVSGVSAASVAPDAVAVSDTSVAPDVAVASDTAVSSASPIPSQPSPVAAAPAVDANGVNADVKNAALNPPVNPVITPGAANSGMAANGTMSMNQMFQPQPAANNGILNEMTAIAVPEGPKPPDPVEEELKAPLKAAGPVPGSIGSAVSMPSQGENQPNGQPNNVAFNDPMNANANPMAPNPQTPAGKKPSIFDKLTAKTKMNKQTLILLSVLAGVIVMALVVVLILVVTGVI